LSCLSVVKEEGEEEEEEAVVIDVAIAVLFRSSSRASNLSFHSLSFS
jgi:hypothetical protein